MSLFKRKDRKRTFGVMTIEEAKAEVIANIEHDIVRYLTNRRYWGVLSDGGSFDIELLDIGFGLEITDWRVDWGGRK